MGVGYPGSGSYGEEWNDFPPTNKNKKMDKENLERFETILKDVFVDDDKLKRVIDDLYEKHGKATFESDVYKLYDDIVNVVKNPVSVFTPRKLADYPLTNVYKTLDGGYVIYDIICPGVNKAQLELTVETDENKTFLRVKGMPWYGVGISAKMLYQDIQIGDAFDKRYDLTPYNVDITNVKSEYKDGILTVYLAVKPDSSKSRNLKVEIK
jgi:HSP20 family molecular chaperone IbpA